MEKTNTHHLLICLICLSSSIKVQQVKYRLRYQYKNYKSSEGKVLKFNRRWYFFILENLALQQLNGFPEFNLNKIVCGQGKWFTNYIYVS